MSRIPGLVWNEGTKDQAIYMAGSPSAALRVDGGRVVVALAPRAASASSPALLSAVPL
jgi:hypothetical protein